MSCRSTARSRRRCRFSSVSSSTVFFVSRKLTSRTQAPSTINRRLLLLRRRLSMAALVVAFWVAPWWPGSEREAERADTRRLHDMSSSLPGYGRRRLVVHRRGTELQNQSERERERERLPSERRLHIKADGRLTCNGHYVVKWAWSMTLNLISKRETGLACRILHYALITIGVQCCQGTPEFAGMEKCRMRSV